MCLILAGILGSAVRLYFSPPRIKSFLQEQIARQNLPYKIDFQSARLILARGLLPAFAIDVTGVDVGHLAPCPTEPFAQIKQLALPIDWWSLFVGRVKLGTVVAEGASLSADRAKCEVPRAQLEPLPEAQPNQQFFASYSTREPDQAQAWYKPEDLESIKKVISGFEIENGTIYFDQSQRFVQINYFEIWQTSHAVAYEGEVTLPAETTYGEVFPPIYFKGEIIPEVLRFDAKSSFDEGELGATLELTKASDPKAPHAKVLFQAGAMPLSIFSDFLRKLGVLQDVKLKPQFMWLSCEVHSEGPLNRLLKHTALKVSSCIVEGDAGRISIGPAVRDESGIWQPFKIDIQRLVIRDLLSMFGEKGPSGILNKFGEIKGTLNYESKNQQSFEGSIEDFEIFFSNHNVRAIQKVLSVDFVAAKAADKISGRLSNVQIDPGQVRGEVKLAFDEKFKNGGLEFNMHEFSLDPQIQSLMADGVFEKLSLKGLLSVADGKIAKWDGELRANMYEGTQLKILKPLAETRFANGLFEIEANASTGELSRLSKWLGWVQKAAPNLKFGVAGESSLNSQKNNQTDNQWLPISNLKTQITIAPTTITWKNTGLTALATKTQVTSFGELASDRQVSGTLTATEPGNKIQKFMISGSLKNPKLEKR